MLAILTPRFLKPSDAVSTKDGEADGIKYRVYSPVKASKSEPLPVGVYAHGGGLVVGNLDAEDICEKAPSCRRCIELIEMLPGQCAVLLPNIHRPPLLV